MTNELTPKTRFEYFLNKIADAAETPDLPVPDAGGADVGKVPTVQEDGGYALETIETGGTSATDIAYSSSSELYETPPTNVDEALKGMEGAVGTNITQAVEDWLDENITEPTDPVIDASLTVSGAAADAKATGDAIAAISGDSGLTAEAKAALLACFQKVAWTVDNGDYYYAALYDALMSTDWNVTNTLANCSSSNSAQSVPKNAPYSATITADIGYTLTGATVSITMGGTDITATAYNNGTIHIASVTGALVISISAAVSVATLESISAVYTQSGTVYETTSLDSLKSDLVVTATYDDTSTATVPSEDYTLSGTLAVGTSTVTVSYGGKTDTFSVTVSSSINYVAVGNPTIVDGIMTVAENKWARSNVALSPSSGVPWKVRMKYKYNTLPSNFANLITGAGSNDAYAKTFIVQENGSNHQYIFYVSSDKTNWTVSNQYTAAMSLSTDTWYYLEFGYTGTKYYEEIKTGGWDGTRVGYKESNSNATIYNGEYVGFGVTSNVSGFDGQVDLHECKMWVNDVLVWQAIAS